MDFRTLINKLDSFNTEAKKEPERMTFSDAINHVKDITFTPPTPAQNEYSIANNIAFKGKDLTDPKVRLALYQDELKRSPGRLLGEIAQRIKPTSDAQIELSMFIGVLSEKQKGTLSKEEQTLAFEVIKQAIRNMDIERDADQSTYKDSDAPDASEMESTNEAEKRWKQTSMSPQEAIAKYGKENVKVKKGALRNGDDMVEVFVESMNEAGFDRDSVTYDEVLPFVKMTYKTLLTDLQTARKDIETYKAGGDTGEEGGDIDMVMPYLRDLKDMQVNVKKILDNPDMDIETVVDYMMPADLDTSPREELIGRFKKSFAKDPQLAKRLFKDPQLDFYSEDVEATEEDGMARGIGTLDKFRELYRKGIGSDDDEVVLRELIQVINDDALFADEFTELRAFTNPSQHDDSEIVTPNAIPGKNADEKIESLIKAIDDDEWVESFVIKLMKDFNIDGGENEDEVEEWFKGQTDVSFNGDQFYEAFGWIEENDENVVEAEYQGRTVKLNKPMRGDVKKFKVYVKNPKGNVVKVNFGDPDMRIKKSNPARRRSFRARHNCDNPGPKTKARYWSCRKW